MATNVGSVDGAVVCAVTQVMQYGYQYTAQSPLVAVTPVPSDIIRFKVLPRTPTALISNHATAIWDKCKVVNLS